MVRKFRLCFVSPFYRGLIEPNVVESRSLENRGKLAEELKRADAVILTYACDQPSTINRLDTFWLLELRRLEV